MFVMSGAVAYNGRRVWSAAQVDGSPTPGRGWLPSTGAPRWSALWPTYPTLADMDDVSRYSAKTFHCCVNWGRRFGSHARTWPEGTTCGTNSAKPVASVPAPVVESYCTADSKKNGGFKGRRRLAPVPSMYWEIP